MGKRNKVHNYSYYGSCDPMKEGNEGIWFEEEDPDSLNYKPQCCTNVYVDLASGTLDKVIEDWNNNGDDDDGYYGDEDYYNE